MSYDPDPGVVLQVPWNITYLSTRDVSLNVPINYVPTPGISLQQACFAHNRYDDRTTTKCLSNILAAGFRKIVIDLYWDAPRHIWSLCPVQIPPTGETSTAGNTTSPSSAFSISLNASMTATRSSLSVVSDAGQPLASPSASAGLQQGKEEVLVRNATTTSTSDDVATVTVGEQVRANTTTISLPTNFPFDDGPEVYANGPFICSSSANIDAVIGILSGFLMATDNTLLATLSYMIFNVHAASPLGDATAPAAAPAFSDLPTGSQTIGVAIKAGLDRYLYTPSMLAADRADVTKSWRPANNFTAPDPAYFTVISGTSISPDGWPSEGYLEFVYARRLLLSYGNIDPQMSKYTVASDEQLVFSRDDLNRGVDVAFSPNGTVTDGCIYNPGNATVAAANSSWAIDELQYNFPTALIGLPYDNITLNEITNITACGVSTLLNSTLLDQTADENITPYQAVLNNMIWSWAPGEPRETPPANYGGDDDENNALFRCAAFNLANEGRWSVRRCQERRRGACRGNGLPFQWTLTGDSSYYTEVANLCPDDYTFAVPRTPLENRYLLQAVRDAGDRDNIDLIWLNFNSLDTQNCWVVGTNSTCAYQSTPKPDDTKQIVVPTIAAIVILVLTVCTLLLKCGSNRRTSRKRQRMHDGWEYEGVPS